MLLHIILAQAEPVASLGRLMLINILLLLTIIGFSGGIAFVLVRRSMRRRVEEERLAAMGTATARIIHQIKNPLQTLLLHAELLEASDVLDTEESRREVAGAVVQEASRVRDLLTELTAYASGVARRLRFETLELHMLVEEVTRRQARAADRDGVALAVVALDEVTVEADPYFLRQAIENVIRNAREALVDTNEPRITVALRATAGRAVLEVGDNGPGIESDRLESVFEPFVTSKSAGMGLGLPICRDIMEGHGGRIIAKPNPGGGTVITMALPSAVREPAPLPQPA